MKTLIGRGLTPITVIVLGLVLVAVTALSATRAAADIVYQDKHETISATLLPYNQEYSYCEDGSFSPHDFVVWTQVSRTKKGICTRKIHRIRSTGTSTVMGLTEPACRFDNIKVLSIPFSDGTLYNVCKDKGPIDVTIERPLKIGLYDKKDRLVREVSAGSATALVHCPETVPAHPPTGPAFQVVTSTSCTRGVDCPPPNNSMVLGGRVPGNTSPQHQICTQTPQPAPVAGTAKSANAIDPIPRTWKKPRVVNREPLIGERTVSSAGIQKTPPQRVKAATPRMQAPGQQWTVAGTDKETGSKGITVGTARGTGTRGIVMDTARTGGTQGIVMGTARGLNAQPLHRPVVAKDGTGKLLFAMPDGRSMVLPDGVYSATNGVRLHISGGRISLIDGMP